MYNIEGEGRDDDGGEEVMEVMVGMERRERRGGGKGTERRGGEREGGRGGRGGKERGRAVGETLTVWSRVLIVHLLQRK